MTRICSSIAVVAALACGACEPADTTLTQPVALPADNPMKYPVRLWDEGIEGETIVLVHVNERGDVDSTMVHTSSGHGAFDSAAMLGARKLRFTPARRGERYIPMWTRLPVKFALDSTAAAAAGTKADSTQ